MPGNLPIRVKWNLFHKKWYELFSFSLRNQNAVKWNRFSCWKRWLYSRRNAKAKFLKWNWKIIDKNETLKVIWEVFLDFSLVLVWFRLFIQYKNFMIALWQDLGFICHLPIARYWDSDRLPRTISGGTRHIARADIGGSHIRLYHLVIRVQHLVSGSTGLIFNHIRLLHLVQGSTTLDCYTFIWLNKWSVAA